MEQRKSLEELMRLLEDSLREELENMNVESPQLDRMLSELKVYALLFAIQADMQGIRRAERIKGLSATARHALAHAAYYIELWEKRQLGPTKVNTDLPDTD